MPNLKLNYLYRDASNYKQFGSAIFSNKNNLSLEEIEGIIREYLIDGVFFIAQDLGLPTLFFDEPNEDDHGWHEFDSLEATNETATNGDIKNLIESAYPSP